MLKHYLVNKINNGGNMTENTINMNKFKIGCVVFALAIILSIVIRQTSLLIIIVILFLAYAVYMGIKFAQIQKGRNNKLLSEGKIITRQQDFYRKKYTYLSNISDFSVIAKNINLDVLREFSIACGINWAKSCILFENRYSDELSKGSFRSVFRKAAVVDGKSSYEYYLAEYKEDSIWKVADFLPANILLTTIEKCLLELDENTKYKYQYLKFNIK